MKSKNIVFIEALVSKMGVAAPSVRGLYFSKIQETISKLNEDELTELSKGTLSRYIKHASRSATMNSALGMKSDSDLEGAPSKEKRDNYKDKHLRTMSKRLKGISKATDKLASNNSKAKRKPRVTRAMIRKKNAQKRQSRLGI